MKVKLFPTRRRMVVLAAITLIPLLAYWLWSPGLDVRDGRHDRSANGLWMQHGWLGDDAWFTRNRKDASLFRDNNRLKALAEELRNEHIRDLYPHLCPCSPSGAIAGSNADQVERFLDAFAGFRVMPWIGGINGSEALVDDVRWRRAFVVSCADLMARHPRLAGIHINIEPMPSGDGDFLTLLEELRKGLPAGKVLSVAAYPPPTMWQRDSDVHWDESYSRAVASRVDQAAVMMYDTSLRSPKLYRHLMQDWTREVLDWYGPKEVLLGLPAYDDAGVGYHDPAVENLANALLGIHAGLNSESAIPTDYRGVSLYCEWEMTPSKWTIFRERFCAPQSPNQK